VIEPDANKACKKLANINLMHRFKVGCYIQNFGIILACYAFGSIYLIKVLVSYYRFKYIQNQSLLKVDESDDEPLDTKQISSLNLFQQDFDVEGLLIICEGYI